MQKLMAVRIKMHIDCRLGSAIFFNKNCPHFSKYRIHNRSGCFFMKHSVFLADRTNGRAIGTLRTLPSVTLCTVAKRCVLEQKLLLRAYRN